MKNILLKIAFVFICAISISALTPKEANAASLHYDSSQGAYIQKVYHQPRQGYELYYPGQKQFKRAALNKYGSINKASTYYFNFINRVKHAHLFSMKGYIDDVTCVYRN